MNKKQQESILQKLEQMRLALEEMRQVVHVITAQVRFTPVTNEDSSSDEETEQVFTARYR